MKEEVIETGEGIVWEHTWMKIRFLNKASAAFRITFGPPRPPISFLIACANAIHEYGPSPFDEAKANAMAELRLRRSG